MRVLGIDPGTALMGFGVVDGEGTRQKAVEYGVLTTPSGMLMELRLQKLYRGVTGLLLRHRPDVLAVEELFFGRNVTTAIYVGQARGVVLLAAADSGIPVREFTPMQVKQGVTGYGRATKQQVQQMVKVLLNLPSPPKPDDVADALAVSICALQSSSFDARVGGVTGR